MAGRQTGAARSATGLLVRSMGVVAGFAGLEHGVFEILQGSGRPDGMVIEAIGPAQRIWVYGSEPAITIIPDFLVTGILAVIAGLLVIVWSATQMHRPRSPLVLGLLTVAMLFVGGGIAPIGYAVMPIIVAAWIHRHPRPARPRSPAARRFFSSMWPWALFVFLLLSVLAIEIAVFGWPLVGPFGADATLAILNWLGYITFFGLGPLAILAAFARDVHDSGNIPD